MRIFVFVLSLNCQKKCSFMSCSKAVTRGSLKITDLSLSQVFLVSFSLFNIFLKPKCDYFLSF